MNNKQIRDLSIAVVLLAVLIVMVLGRIRPRVSPAVTPAVAPVAANDLSFLETARQDEKRRAAQEEVWSREWGRDPFVLTETAGAGGGLSFKLTGVVWDEIDPIAVIDQKLYRVGETVEGYRIVKIHQSSVELESGKERFELKLFQG